MIHNIRFVRRQDPAKRNRALIDMQQELRKILNTWKDKRISGDAVKLYPEFARGYMTALKEVLGENEE